MRTPLAVLVPAIGVIGELGLTGEELL